MPNRYDRLRIFICVLLKNRVLNKGLDCFKLDNGYICDSMSRSMPEKLRETHFGVLLDVFDAYYVTGIKKIFAHEIYNI